MRTDIAQPIRLADYRPPDYLIDSVDLDVRLDPHATRVVARLAVRPNPKGRGGADLVLDGDGLSRAASCSTVRNSTARRFRHARPADHRSPPQRPFTLEIETEIDPSANTFSWASIARIGLFRPMRN